MTKVLDQEWHDLIAEARRKGHTTDELRKWFESVKNRAENAAE